MPSPPTIQGDESISVPGQVIEVLFIHRDAVLRHIGAPQLREREEYLGRLSASGHTKRFVEARAFTLWHVVRFLNGNEVSITEADIAAAADKWAAESQGRRCSGFLQRRGVGPAF